jgi:hypothetical protein
MAGGRWQTNVSINDPSPASILMQAKSAFHTIYIQKIVYSPSAAIVPGTLLGFLDSLTGQSIGTITVMPPSVAQPPYTIDFGVGDSTTSGTPLSKGANLILSIIVGGAVGRMHIKGYQTPLYLTTPYVGPMTAGFTR